MEKSENTINPDIKISSSPAGHVAWIDPASGGSEVTLDGLTHKLISINETPNLIAPVTLGSTRNGKTSYNTYYPQTPYTIEEEKMDYEKELDNLKLELIDILSRNLPTEYDCDEGFLRIHDDSVYIGIYHSWEYRVMFDPHHPGEMDEVICSLEYGVIYGKNNKHGISPTVYMPLDDAIDDFKEVIKKFKQFSELKEES